MLLHLDDFLVLRGEVRVAFLQHVEDVLRRHDRRWEPNPSCPSQATTLTLPWYQPASMQQGDEPRFSRTMRRHKRESWDSTAFHLFLEILRSGFPLWMRPSKTRSLVISTKETDGWILDRGIAAFSPQPLLGWAYPDRS